MTRRLPRLQTADGTPRRRGRCRARLTCDHLLEEVGRHLLAPRGDRGAVHQHVEARGPLRQRLDRALRRSRRAARRRSGRGPASAGSASTPVIATARAGLLERPRDGGADPGPAGADDQHGPAGKVEPRRRRHAVPLGRAEHMLVEIRSPPPSSAPTRRSAARPHGAPPRPAAAAGPSGIRARRHLGPIGRLAQRLGLHPVLGLGARPAEIEPVDADALTATCALAAFFVSASSAAFVAA